MTEGEGLGFWVSRVNRVAGAAIASGFVGGAIAGFGARLVMFAVRLSNPAFNGGSTHAGYVNGVWTLEGTMSVVVQGAFSGLPGGAVYLLLRRFLGPTRLVRGLLAGLLLLTGFGDVVLDGSYEFSRFVSPAASVAAFAALFPLYGVAVALVADAIAPPRSMRHRRLRVIGSAGLLFAGLAGAWRLADVLRFRYGF